MSDILVELAPRYEKPLTTVDSLTSLGLSEFSSGEEEIPQPNPCEDKVEEVDGSLALDEDEEIEEAPPLLVKYMFWPRPGVRS